MLSTHKSVEMSKLLNLLLIFPFLALSLSCSDNKKTDSVVDPLPSKKLVKIEAYTIDPVKGGYGTVTSLFTYEGDRLKSHQRLNDFYGFGDDVFEYRYEGNKISYTSYREDYVYILDDKKRIISKTRLVEGVEETRDEYVYDENGYLVTLYEIDIPSGLKEESTFTYSNGLLTHISYAEGWSNAEIDVEYSHQTDKLGLGALPSEYQLEFAFTEMYGTVFPSQIFYQLSMLGRKSKRLISRIGNLKYEYILDDDGYVKTIKQRSINNPHTIDYTLFYDK